MTERQDLIRLLDHLGIRWGNKVRLNDWPWNNHRDFVGDASLAIVPEQTVVIGDPNWRDMDDDPTYNGYHSFYTEFYFDKDGKFLKYGCWE